MNELKNREREREKKMHRKLTIRTQKIRRKSAEHEWQKKDYVFGELLHLLRSRRNMFA